MSDLNFNAESSSENLDWEKIMQEDEQFCKAVMESDHSPIEKMKLLSSNPYSSQNIISDMLQHAPYFENFIEEKSLFPNGEDIARFIVTNRNRFEALSECWNDLKENHEELYNANRRYALDVSTAVTLYELYETDALITYVPSNCQDRELVKSFCKDAMTIVEICAIYFKETGLKSNNDIVYYRVGQELYLKKYFDILREERKEQTSTTDAPSPKETGGEGFTNASVNIPTENKEKDDPVSDPEESTKKAKKPPINKKKLIFILDAVCLAIFVILLILAITIKNSTINIIMLVTGVVEIASAALLFYIALQRERFTCPECGTKRIHSREYLSTSEKVTTSNYGRVNYPEGNKKTTFTHHYMDTYACPNCGTKTTNKVNKSGGEYIIFNNGHINDTRRDPREF